jgi:hypothetical protein
MNTKRFLVAALCALPLIAAAADNSLFGQPFHPQTDANGIVDSVTLVGTATAESRIALPARDDGYNQLEITNQTTGWIYVKVGSLAQIAGKPATKANGYQVAPGSDKVITIDPYVTEVSAFFDANGNVGLELGEGG